MARLFQIKSNAFFPAIVIACAVFLLSSARRTEAVDTRASTNSRPARVSISGYGILGDRELKRMLTTLELGGRKPELFTAAFVEDAALILSSRVKRDGFLQPLITIELGLANGQKMKVTADELLENPLPRTLQMRQASFKIRKGVLYHYRTLAFEGLESIPEKQARSYFMETGGLLALKANRIYTPEKLSHGLNSLTDILNRQGYQEAKTEVADLKRDDKTGAIRARIRITHGVQSVVHSVREEFFDQGGTSPAQTQTVYRTNLIPPFGCKTWGKISRPMSSSTVFPT